MTMCLDHQQYLNWQCGDCQKMPRSVRSTVFKGHMDNPVICGNPNGTKTPCTGDLSSAECFPAPMSQLCFAGRIMTALAGGRVTVCGQEVMPRQYLSSLKALAIVLLQLASAQPTASLSQTLIPAELVTRLVDRHWATAPPRDTALRSRVFACADALLSKATVHAAAENLRDWVSLVPKVGEARLKWLFDRSPADPLIMGLLQRADQDRWRVSRLLSSTALGQELSPRAVPQQLPEHLYDRHLAHLLTTRSTTGRVFGSLSIMRIVMNNATWAMAAKELGLPPEVGPRTARTVQQRLIADTRQLHSAIVSTAGELDRSRDWRVEEDRVTHVHNASPDLNPLGLGAHGRQQRERCAQLVREMMDAEVRAVGAKLFGCDRKIDALEQRVGRSAHGGMRAGGPVPEGQESDLLHAAILPLADAQSVKLRAS